MIGLGRAYVIAFEAVAVTAQQDFFYIKPAADKPCFLEEVKISNVGVAADAGDAQEEELEIVIFRVPATVTVGSGGSASATGTLNAIATNDTAASATCRTNDTTKATTSGTLRLLDSDGWNVRIPYIWVPKPEHGIPCANAEALVVRLNSTPTDSLTVNGRAVFRELP